MKIAWPADLPCMPILNSPEEVPQDNRIVFQPEVGPSIDRRRATAAGTILPMTLRMTRAQVDSYLWWFKNILKDGTLTFETKHPRTREINLWKFAENPHVIAQRGLQYDVRLNLFSMPQNRNWRTTPETDAIAAAFAAAPPEAFKTAIDDAVRALIYHGLWADFDLLQVYAAPSAADATINWRAPGIYNATLTGTTIFTAYEGIAGDGATGFIDTGFDPSPDTDHLYKLNDAHWGTWVTSSTASTTPEVGIVPGSSGEVLGVARSSINEARGAINAVGSLIVSGVTDGRGHLGMNRTAVSERQMYRNGALAAADTQNSTSVPSGKLSLLTDQGVTFSTKQVAAFHVGRSLTAEKWQAMNGILEKLLAAAKAV